jgi:hypothetical protein
MSAAEFSRMVEVRAIEGRGLDLVANAEECAALARRFALVAVDRLSAHVDLTRDGTAVDVVGRLSAAIVQSCAVSGADLAATIDAPAALRFVPEASIATFAPNAEIELAAEDLDQIPYAGTTFDIGEAVAQSLALNIDPFATGPDAERVRTSGVLGGEAVSPFAGLAALRGKLAE